MGSAHIFVCAGNKEVFVGCVLRTNNGVFKEQLGAAVQHLFSSRLCVFARDILPFSGEYLLVAAQGPRCATN